MVLVYGSYSGNIPSGFETSDRKNYKPKTTNHKRSGR